MTKYLQSKPHVVILAPHDLGVAEALSNGLNHYGISTFLSAQDIKPGQIWIKRIRDEINSANAAIVFSSPSYQTNWTELEIELLNHRLSADPAFIVIPIIRNPNELDSLPKALRSFQALPLHDGEFTPSVSKQLAEAVFSSWDAATQDTQSSETRETLSQLIAEAEVVLSRLEFIELSKKYSPFIYENIVLLSVTSVGIFLCIIAFISRAAWFEYLIVSGSILSIAGSAIALFTAHRLKQRKRIETRASMLYRKIEGLIDKGKKLQSESDLQRNYEV